MKVYIVGAGGHGRDIADIARACGHTTAFLDDDTSVVDVVGKPSELQPSWPYVIGVHDPAVRIRFAGVAEAVTLVHPSATVSPDAVLSPGAVIGAGAVMGPGTVIGLHSHIGAGCTVTRTSIGNCVSISPGVDIAGDCMIRSGVQIGVGARMANLITVGRDARVGAGAVVVDNVDPGTTVAGVPARPLVRA